MNFRYPKWIILGLFILSIGPLSGQEWLIDEPVQIQYDSLFSVQFIALKDGSEAFSELARYGTVLREYIQERDVYRFSLGYYSTSLAARNVLRQLQLRGYTDAFIKKIESAPKRPSDLFKSTKDEVADKDKSKSDESLQTTSTVDESSKIESRNTAIAEDELSEASNKVETIDLTLLYTGKSFGVLGNTRSQAEHELVTAYAIEKDIKFKLVSHACWRAKGLTIFLPSDEPEGEELETILKHKSNWELLENIPALRTNSVLFFQDPDRTDFDMMKILRKHERVELEFPEIEDVQVKIYRTVIDEMECFIVEEPGALWPEDESHWALGEVNRIDFGKTGRLFELPINKGGFGERASLLKKVFESIDTTHSNVILLDVGHRNADFNISHKSRSKVDFKGLDALGYHVLVPYEYELLLGVEELDSISKRHPSIKLLGTNISARQNKDLFDDSHIIELSGVKIGFIGLVDPNLAPNLPGRILKTLKFDDVTESAQKSVDKLLKKGAHVVIALSNMSKSNNALLSEDIKGIDIILTNFTDHGKNLNQHKIVEIKEGDKRGIGAPLHITNLSDYGISIGRVDLTLVRKDSMSAPWLSHIEERDYAVNDREPTDYELMDSLTNEVQVEQFEKGDLLFPAFIDIVEQEPDLEDYDATTKNGRISKALWEKFIARILTNGAPAEVAIVRHVPSFLPLIGKLHEREVRSWLWLEDEIILMDLKGRDIKRLLEADQDDNLVTSGIESFRFPGGIFYTIMGRPMQDDVYYRVATTNVISNGVFSEYFRWAQRVADSFEIEESGHLKYNKNNGPLALRDYVLSELTRIRSYGKGKEHHRRIAKLLVPDIPYEKLFSFNFVRPTLWTSLNRAYKGDGYEAIPESRIISGNSFVIGAQGGIVTTLDTEKSAWDMGFQFAFAEQSADDGTGVYQKTENADDININLTYRYRGKKREALHPYTRIEYDSEFTPTINRLTGLENPRQKILRNVVGISKGSTFKWPILELGATAENDFSNSNYQYGIQGRSLGRFPIDKNWNVVYSLTNNFNYYLPNKNDTERDLSFKYNMVHEVLVPLFGDVSLSVAADFFFFRGKTEINRDPGMSMLMKVGLSYNRLWKPRFQSLF